MKNQYIEIKWITPKIEQLFIEIYTQGALGSNDESAAIDPGGFSVP